MKEKCAREQALLQELETRIENVLVSHVPEYAGSLQKMREQSSDGIVGIYALLMAFGNDFLFPEIARGGRFSDAARRGFMAIEELLSDGEEVVAEAAFFGAIEPLGELLKFVSRQDVGPRVAHEIEVAYPAWAPQPR